MSYLHCQHQLCLVHLWLRIDWIICADDGNMSTTKAKEDAEDERMEKLESRKKNNF